MISADMCIQEVRQIYKKLDATVQRKDRVNRRYKQGDLYLLLELETEIIVLRKKVDYWLDRYFEVIDKKPEYIPYRSLLIEVKLEPAV